MAVTSPVVVDKADISVYKSDMDLYLDEFLADIGADDASKISSSQWAAAMIYLGDHVIKPNRQDFIAAGTSSNDYNIFSVSDLADLYIYLCLKFSHRICIEHFSYLSGISYDTLYRWRDDNRKLYIYDCSVSDNGKHRKGFGNGEKVTISRSDVFKKLVQNTVSSADDIMLSKSGVNSIAYRNAVQERYNSRRQDQQKTYDAGNIALQLGITDKLASLPDHDGK